MLLLKDMFVIIKCYYYLLNGAKLQIALMVGFEPIWKQRCHAFIAKRHSKHHHFQSKGWTVPLVPWECHVEKSSFHGIPANVCSLKLFSDRRYQIWVLLGALFLRSRVVGRQRWAVPGMQCGMLGCVEFCSSYNSYLCLIEGWYFPSGNVCLCYQI